MNVLAIGAHPDDIEYGCGGMLTKYAEKGHAVYLFIASDGALGGEPTVRDAVVTELPLAPTCRADCPGLCAECGALLADDPQHGHETIDPRWAALESVGAAAAGAQHDNAARRDSAGDTDNTGAYVAGGYGASGDSAATTNDVRSRAGALEES